MREELLKIVDSLEPLSENERNDLEAMVDMHCLNLLGDHLTDDEKMRFKAEVDKFWKNIVIAHEKHIGRVTPKEVM